jgi:hypothetical protein
MYPIYKFELSANGTTNQAFPIYGDGITKDFDRETGQQFFREKLNGKLTFEGPDYDFIMAQAFETKFGLELFISQDGGTTWASYWRGEFWKTDCTFDEDAETVVASAAPIDRYTDILNGIEKEFNLIDLLPEMAQVKADKRPMIQVYVPGDSVIACFLFGMWWEQECAPVEESDTVTIGGQNYPALTYKYFFAKNTAARVISPTGVSSVPDVFVGNVPDLLEPSGETYTNGAYKFIYRTETISGGFRWYLEIARVSDSVVMWRYTTTSGSGTPWAASSYNLSPVSGSGASGTVTITWRDIPVYARYVLDVPTIGGQATHELPEDDLCPENRNYHRAIGYGISNVIFFSQRLTTTPTKWGLYQPGQYYQEPYMFGGGEFYPVSRNSWGRVSIWFAFSSMDWYFEQQGRAQFTIKHAYPISSVISVLLAQIAPGVTHDGTTTYSEFLYGTNLLGITQTILITPKTNLIYSGYDQPAQKAPITLKEVTDMLRDCYRCYWWIDDNNRFRIEHIEYFRNGGSYYGAPVVGIDLTAMEVIRSGKTWDTARRQYSFEKPEMAGRYQFGWMDDVTELFEGYPIDIISQYVQKDRIEQVSVSKFTSDVDYILLNPSVISKDGFVLLAAIVTAGEYVLPYEDVTPQSGTQHILQNAYAAFVKLQEYYAYDMPAPSYQINGIIYAALGVKKLRRQEISFPAINDPNLLELVKTGLGNGTIEKVSLNLSSRNAKTTLMYGTE